MLSLFPKILRSYNLNIFPEDDAFFYIPNTPEKHEAMELHTYKSMAQYSLSHNFSWSPWNRWATRNEAIFQIKNSNFKNFPHDVLVTPLKVSYVNAIERCTDLANVELEYELDPPVQMVSNLLYRFTFINLNTLIAVQSRPHVFLEQ